MPVSLSESRSCMRPVACAPDRFTLEFSGVISGLQTRSLYHLINTIPRGVVIQAIKEYHVSGLLDDATLDVR